MPPVKTLTNALDRLIEELERRKVLAMRLERRPGAYYITLENGAKHLLCDAVYASMTCVRGIS